MKIEIRIFASIFMLNCVVSEYDDIYKTKEYEDIKNQIIYYQQISNLNCDCSFMKGLDINYAQYCYGRKMDDVKINYYRRDYEAYGVCW